VVRPKRKIADWGVALTSSQEEGNGREERVSVEAEEDFSYRRGKSRFDGRQAAVGDGASRRGHRGAFGGIFHGPLPHRDHTAVPNGAMNCYGTDETGFVLN
jgi:hypothetical protein